MGVSPNGFPNQRKLIFLVLALPPVRVIIQIR